MEIFLFLEFILFCRKSFWINEIFRVLLIDFIQLKKYLLKTHFQLMYTFVIFSRHTSSSCIHLLPTNVYLSWKGVGHKPLFSLLFLETNDVREKHRENRKTLPFEHLIDCQYVKLFLLNYVTITVVTITTVTITTVTITTVG